MTLYRRSQKKKEFMDAKYARRKRHREQPEG